MTWVIASLNSPTNHPLASWKVTSAVANDRVPNLSFNLWIRIPFKEPSSLCRGTKNNPSPFVPSCSPIRAVTRAKSAVTLEQNHLSPFKNQTSLLLSSGVAVTALIPTSEPPWISVMN